MKGVVTLVVLLCAAMMTKAQSLDERILKSINSHGTSFKDGFAKAGAASVYPVSGAVPAVQFTLGLTRRQPALKRDALWSAGVFAGNFVFTRVLKYVVDRPRPFETLPYIVKRTNESNGHSFPSGHASAAFCTATWLTLQYKKWYVAVPAYLWAGAAGYARMYQGVHYPSDVLGGAVIGSGIAWAGYALQQHYKRKKKTANQSLVVSQW